MKIPKNKNLSLQNSQNQETTTEELPHLRPKLKKLCEEILQGQTRIKAHEIAGFKAKNDIARSQAVSDYLTKPEIRRYIAVREKQIAEDLRKKTNITKEFMLNEFIASMLRSRESKKERELIQAGAEINKILGFNAPIETKELSNLPMFDISSLPEHFKLRLIALVDEIQEWQAHKQVEDVEVLQIAESVPVIVDSVPIADKVIPQNTNESAKVESENEPKAQ
jgi:chorismate mutase